MARIIFEYTQRGKYASQGDTATGNEGYNIWVQYPDDDYVHYLGHCKVEEAPRSILYYRGNGDDVVVAKEPSDKNGEEG